jgi:penicillin-binding protein 2
LEAGDLGLDETIFCDSYLDIGGRKFHEHRATGYGDVGLIRALEVSCDVFFYQVGLRTGPETIMEKAKEFGLDKPTGIELPGETSRMLLPTPAWKKRQLFEPWYAGDTANIAIGQGDLLVTPLQMACLTASVARGDTITKPTIIKKNFGMGDPTPLPPPTGTREGDIVRGFTPNPAAARSQQSAEGGEINRVAMHPPEAESSRGSSAHGAPELPFKPYSQGWAKVIEGMKTAATTGTARLVHVDGLMIAGKTGTAQVKVNGVNLTVAWFVGFAPADDPQVAVSVVVEGTSPDDEYEGGTIAAPIARSFFEEWMKQQAVHPAVSSLDKKE